MSEKKKLTRAERKQIEAAIARANRKMCIRDRMIATLTRHQIGTVERALAIFQQLGLVEQLDCGLLYMTDIEPVSYTHLRPLTGRNVRKVGGLFLYPFSKKEVNQNGKTQKP